MPTCMIRATFYASANLLLKRRSLLRAFNLVCFLSFSQSLFAQIDTNYLYIDSVDLRFSDPKEKLESITFQNGSNHLVFNNSSRCHLIGIRRSKPCRMIIETNYAEIRIENINEYIAFTDTKHRIVIEFPKQHSTCTEITYTTPQNMYQNRKTFPEKPIDYPQERKCVLLETFPVDFATNEEFPRKHLLE